MHTEAYDALVNLKKYIREYSGEPIGRIACIQLIDEFIKKAVRPPAPAIYHVKNAPDDAIYIGRRNALLKLETSPYHNPFVVGVDGTREQVLEKFEEYWYAPKQEALRVQAIVELSGKNLKCWCKRRKKSYACHGDIIIEFLDTANRLEEQRAKRLAFTDGPKWLRL